MTKQHKALELADAYAEASFTQGLHHKLADPESKKFRAKLEAEIERQHALIVQMREALKQIADFRPLTFAECADAEAVIGIAEIALTAANEYLEKP